MFASGGSVECEVYFCSKTIPTSASGITPLFENCNPPLLDACINHYLVAFDYGGTEVLICEAEIDHAGILTGMWHWNKTPAFMESTMKKTNLGRYKIPERRVQELLQKMGDCGCYHPTKNNCQTWTVSFLRNLDIKPPEEQLQAKKSVNQGMRLGADIGGTAFFGSDLASCIRSVAFFGAGMLAEKIYCAISKH